MPSSEAIRDFLDARPPDWRNISADAKRQKARLAVVMQVILCGGRITPQDLKLVQGTIDSAQRMLPQLERELSDLRREDYADEESFARARLLSIRRSMPSDELAAHNFERMTLIEAATSTSASVRAVPVPTPRFAPMASLPMGERRLRRTKIHQNMKGH